jgi:hypothetical protein
LVHVPQVIAIHTLLHSDLLSSAVNTATISYSVLDAEPQHLINTHNDTNTQNSCLLLAPNSMISAVRIQKSYL